MQLRFELAEDVKMVDVFIDEICRILKFLWNGHKNTRMTLIFQVGFVTGNSLSILFGLIRSPITQIINVLYKNIIRKKVRGIMDQNLILGTKAWKDFSITQEMIEITKLINKSKYYIIFHQSAGLNWSHCRSGLLIDIRCRENNLVVPVTQANLFYPLQPNLFIVF